MVERPGFRDGGQPLTVRGGSCRLRPLRADGLVDDDAVSGTLAFRARDTRLIDGRAIAAAIKREVADEVAALWSASSIRPGLAVVLVGDDPASQIYVRSKAREARIAGMNSFEHLLPADISGETLLGLVARLNADPSVHGILVQLPLPAQIDTPSILEAIDPDKDVDGFHILNAGRLATGLPGFVPCTPLGCMILIRSVLGDDLAGLRAVVIGTSNIVGRPIAQLLLRADCTVVSTHSKTRDVARETRSADILVVAAGSPGLVRGDWIKPGAVVIDVGINRVTTEAGSRLVGDVAAEEAIGIAGALTPVPGGVGPMTVACLLRNTLDAATRSGALRRENHPAAQA